MGANRVGPGSSVTATEDDRHPRLSSLQVRELEISDLVNLRELIVLAMRDRLHSDDVGAAVVGRRDRVRAQPFGQAVEGLLESTSRPQPAALESSENYFKRSRRKEWSPPSLPWSPAG